MAYPYGMQGVPKVGNGLGGLPQRERSSGQNPLLNDPVIVDFQDVAGLTGTYMIPREYKYFRVTAVGSGGSSSNTSSAAGAGGGGVSQSNIEQVTGRNSAISYVAPAKPSLGADGATAYAMFGDVSLQATGGRAPIATTGGIGGSGSGGRYNFDGGKGADSSGSSSGSGGGAAGTRGKGGDGTFWSAQTPALTDGLNDGGGGGYAVSAGPCAGGGGVGAVGGRTNSQNNTGGPLGWAGVRTLLDGGKWGGGGAGGGSSQVGSRGGEGGVRIELW